MLALANSSIMILCVVTQFESKAFASHFLYQIILCAIHIHYESFTLPSALLFLARLSSFSDFFDLLLFCILYRCGFLVLWCDFRRVDLVVVVFYCIFI